MSETPAISTVACDRQARSAVDCRWLATAVGRRQLAARGAEQKARGHAICSAPHGASSALPQRQQAADSPRRRLRPPQPHPFLATA